MQQADEIAQDKENLHVRTVSLVTRELQGIIADLDSP